MNRDDVVLLLDSLIADGLGMLANAAQGIAERPTDQAVHALFFQNLVDLHLLVSVRRGLAEPATTA